MGYITELMTMQRKSFGCVCKKIDKDHYVDIRTGELFDYDHTKNRSQGIKSIRVTLAKIRALINTNITKPENVRWITLTYRENMTDTKKLYKDYEKFWKRFIYWCGKQGYSKPEYITVQEPQGRGAWHIHAFFIWDKKAPFISNNDVLERLWRHGFTKCKALSDCDNIGAYFSAYLADMPLDEVARLSEEEQYLCMNGDVKIEEKKFVNHDGLEKDKHFVKGGRLYLYPVGMNIYRHSRGIKAPLIERMTYAEAQKKVSAATETFSCYYEIIDDDGATINRIRKSYYNSKRK